MKNKYLLGLLFCFLALGIHAQEVPVDKAREVAVSFFKTRNGNASFKSIQCIQHDGKNTMYVFEFDPTGYVIVSADYAVSPILCYSTNAEYDNVKDSYSFSSILLDMASGIFTVSNDSSKSINEKWACFSDESNLKSSITDYSNKSVEPMLEDCWHQLDPFNYYCPYKDTEEGPKKTAVGCVALAIGRVIRHWGYPSRGRGEYRYYSEYVDDTLYANFEKTYYNYEYMQDNDDPYHYAAELLYHCGIALRMKYGAEGIQSSPGRELDILLREHFRYFGFLVSEPTDPDHAYLLLKSLDMGVPVQYKYGSHRIVLDGYEEENGVIHFSVRQGDIDCDYDTYYTLETLLAKTCKGWVNIQPPVELIGGTLSGTFDNTWERPLYASTIQADCIIQNGSLVSLGGQTIILNKGFKVEKGSYFTADYLEEDFLAGEKLLKMSGADILNTDNLQVEPVLNLYPNPTNGILNLNCNITGSYDIYTMTGILVYSGLITGTNTVIDFTNQSKGLYVLKFSNETTTITKTFSVE